MIRDSENRDKERCDNCGRYDWSRNVEKNNSGDLVCPDCWDETNAAAQKIKSYADIERLNANEAHGLIRSLLSHINIEKPDDTTIMQEHCELMSYYIKQNEGQ